MKILLVCNNAFTKGNGLCTAILDLYDRLSAAGQEVRILSVGNTSDEGIQAYYPLKHFKFPFFEPIIYSNGFCYASIDRKLISEAISWADVVHLEEAMPLEVSAVRIARKLGKPCVASFHLLAENIMANLGMGVNNPLNSFVTWLWKVLVYDHCTDIHCPSPTVRDHLERFGYKSRLHTFSNGIRLASPEGEAASAATPYMILCIGRFANEKSQMTLIEAMRYSKYARQIRLVFAGKGPKEAKYVKAARKLKKEGILSYDAEFGFHTHEELRMLARKAYLYIHCAWVEVEGLSCLEAIMEGAVPVIARGPLSATSQFALDERSTFPARDSRALAERIDWWIEHPEERLRMGSEYASSVVEYSAGKSTREMISMYTQSLEEWSGRS